MSHNPKTAPSQPSGPLDAWRRLTASGAITADAGQGEMAAHLQALHEQLLASTGKSSKPRLLRKSVPAPRGLYIWGEVGRGKSMLMDLFFTHAPVARKRRVHFHRFMQEVHARIHALRQSAHTHGGSGDPLAVLIGQLTQELQLLCFDELQATDVADASLIFRLFEGLFAGGVVIVSTSNRPPGQLYTGGVQAERFTRCIQLLEEKMDVKQLSGPHDYRTRQLRALSRLWFTPLGPQADAFMADAVQKLAHGAPAVPLALEVHGRTLNLATHAGTIGRASFAELCETALGPADYLAIAESVDTMLLTDIPILTPEKRNEAKRFVTLIDALYENRVRLLATAAAPPEALYPTGDGSFEFARTISRLSEMQSERYLAQG